MQNNQCKICRRLGTKLFLKGEKCLSPKCTLVRKPYPPGMAKKKKRMSALSEYGKELKEKQKLKNWYHLRERQLANYVENNPAPDLLIEALESRFDNVILRLGLVNSRAQARQHISHGHFFLNGQAVNLPSYQLKKGDQITLNPASQKKKAFSNLMPLLKKHQAPVWLKMDADNLKGEVVGVPTLEEAAPPAEMSTIFEYYSR